ncbi:MAG TPA: zinc-binding dehydrogenase [Candidatus Faecousia intestinigallinarum]|nr:zinc-binding dehydrogenase [Candidatus Faecousia intestinigallinarum]
MKAAVLRAFHQPLSIEEVPIPQPQPGEVLAKVLACGLCASDLHIGDGMIDTVHLPYTPGHEICGEIVALGEGVTEFPIGTRFVAGIDILCGTCRHCRSGRGNLCVNRIRLGFERDGGQAQYCRIPAECVFPISPSVPPEMAAVVPDAVACMYHAMRQGQVGAGSVICITGIGGLGMQGIQIAKHLGATVIATSRTEEKLALARSFGADYTVNTRCASLQEEISRITGGALCDVVFDNIGSAESVNQALGLLCRGGKVIVVGYNEPTLTANYMDLVINEKEIIGIRGSTREELREVIQMVESGAIRPYIYKTYPLTQIVEALDDLRTGKTLGRTVVLPNAEQDSGKE